MKKNKVVYCSECSKPFKVSIRSRRYKCDSCKAKFRELYIKTWNGMNRSRILLYNKRYNKKRRHVTILQPGTINEDDMNIREGHVEGYVRLRRQLKKIYD